MTITASSKAQSRQATNKTQPAPQVTAPEKEAAAKAQKTRAEDTITRESELVQKKPSAEFGEAKKAAAVHADAAAQAHFEHRLTQTQSGVGLAQTQGAKRSTLTKAEGVTRAKQALGTGGVGPDTSSTLTTSNVPEPPSVGELAQDARAARAEHDEAMPAAQARLHESQAALHAAEADAAQHQSSTPALATARAEHASAQAEVTRLSDAVTQSEAALVEMTHEQTTRALTTNDRALRQEIVDSLSRAAEVSGSEGARLMGETSARVINEQEFPRQAARDFGDSIQASIESGQGALLGVQTTEATTGPHKRGLSQSVALGIATVTREFDAAAADIGVHEARFAQFSATHGSALNAEQSEAARAQFMAEAAPQNARYDAASRALLSVGQGAEAALETGLARFMDDQVGGSSDAMTRVGQAVPEALKTESGQAYLRDALRSSPSGQLPIHLVANDEEEARAFTASLSSVVMSEEGASRREALNAVANHGEALGLPEMQSFEVRDALSTLSSEGSASELKSGLSALGNTLSKLGRTTTTPMGSFGAALGLTSALLSAQDAQSVREYGEVAAKGGYAISSIASDTLDVLGKGNGLARQIATTAGAGLGRAAAVFDGINAIGHLAEGDAIQAGISTASATGAVLATTGKRVAGGYVGLAASVAQVGYDLFNAGQERAAYNAQATRVFESMGFAPEAAAELAQMRSNSGAVFAELGRGQGPGGSDFSASEMFERAQTLEPRQIRFLSNYSAMMPQDAEAIAQLSDASFQASWYSQYEEIQRFLVSQ